MLDRERPLWELWFVEGLEDGHVALIQKTHHSLIDGVSGVDVATLLLDASPDYVPPDRRRVDARARAGSVAAAARHAARAAHRTGRVRALVPLAVARSAPRDRARDARRPLDGHDGDARRDRAAHLDQRADRPSPAALGRARSAGRDEGDPQALGGTVNDVVLAGVAGGLQRLFMHRGDDDRRPAAARAVPGVGALRRPTRRARQQGLGDVRDAAGRRPARGRSAARDLGADRRPQGAAPGGRRRDV